MRDREENIKSGCAGVLFLMTLAAFAVLTMFSGCTTTRYVPVETVKIRTDTLHHYTHNRDSVWLHDSVYVAMQGDTLRIEKWRTKYQYKFVTDTLWRSMTDSVRVEVPYPVEKPLSWWQQTKMDFGGMAMGGLLIALCIAVIWLVKRFKR